MFSSASPATLTTNCGALDCDENSNIVLREMFADALERAINSTENTAFDEPETPDHPFHADFENDVEFHDEFEDDGENVVRDASDFPEPDPLAWENHSRYSDEIDCEKDDQSSDGPIDDVSEIEDQLQQNLTMDGGDSNQGDQLGLAWEDHPYYDTPEEELEDVEWEDSFYY